MSNNLNEVTTEAKEVYNSIEKIQSALADGKITVDEAGILLESLSALSTDLPELAHEGKELINNIEQEVEKDLTHVQESKFFKAFSALRAEPSWANFAKLLYSIVEHFFPSEQTTTTASTESATDSITTPKDQADTDGSSTTAPTLETPSETSSLVADHVETVSDTTTA